MKKNQWKIYTIVMSIALLLMSIAFCVSMNMYKKTNDNYKYQIENSYSLAYYNTIYAFENINSNLSKLEVSNSASYQIELLDKISSNANLAEVSLMCLTTSNTNMNIMAKYLNQLNDYANYLMKKLVNNDYISQSEYENLQAIYKNSNIYYLSLKEIIENADINNFSFINLLNGKTGNINDIYASLTNDEMEYPSLIYDGPFSDALNEKTPNELTGEIFNDESGKNEALKYLNNVKNIEFYTKGNGSVNSLLYKFTLEDGNKGNIQISEKGGKLYSLNIERDLNSMKFTEKECVQKGLEYLNSIGYENMEAVWASKTGNGYYINYVTKIDDIIIYPEMMKLYVAGDNGDILAAEGLTYILNYKSDRILNESQISEEECLSLIKQGGTVKNCRLALIPMPSGKDVLSFEINVYYGINEYYIYLDCSSGFEINILKTVDSNGGKLLV